MEADSLASDQVWIAHPAIDGEWVSAKVTARHDDGTVTVTAADGHKTVQKVEDLMLSNNLPVEGVEDMQKLNYLHEPALLHNLSHRFFRDHVYTYTGRICISINPFNWEVSNPLYTQEKLLSYRGTDLEGRPPHVYAISERAYMAVLRRNRGDGGENQSILVSGESGAGKTEAVKIMMGFLAEVSNRGRDSNVAERVMQSNPLLEAFGNARTLRNDNSSRFGKFIEIQFDAQSRMCGACIHVYLLEKTRVVGQAAGERNYHSFYQLLAGADDGLCSRLQLRSAYEYAYINQSGCMSIEGVDEVKHFTKTMNAMSIIGLDEDERNGSLALLSAMLCLSNVAFVADENNEDCAIVSPDSQHWLATAASLTGCEGADELSTALCTRQICARDEWYTVRLTVEQACDSRDALSKALYGRLFEWLVMRVNTCLSANVQPARGARSTSELFVGILDIFGFESFARNSFEQLCINYANERLQQQFNWDIFKSEQVEYEAEGIEWQYIEFTDNQECLDLIDAKPFGAMHVLNEESSLQAGTDDKFLDKVKAQQKGNRYFDVPRRLVDGFVVCHYAGDVEYKVAGFREKNKDSLHPDLAGLMQGSESVLVQQLFSQPAGSDAVVPGASPSRAPGSTASGNPPTGGGKRKGKADLHTVSAQFMAQLSSLMRTINATEVQYVRCIKPNADAAPSAFDRPRVAHQLRCAGVLEAIRIARLAYPNRMPHVAFVERYAVLAPELDALLGAARRACADGDATRLRTECARLLAHIVKGEQRFQLGSSKVFFRANLLEQLEAARSRTLGIRAVRLQTSARRWLAIRRFSSMRAAAIRVQAAHRRHAKRSRFVQNRVAAVRIQSALRALVARILYKRLRAAVHVQAVVRRLVAQRRSVAMRRERASVRLGSRARGASARRHFVAMRNASVRLQAIQRMRAQRRYYIVALEEKREEEKMSNRLAKLERQLEQERRAREAAEHQRQEMARTVDGRLADAVSEAEARVRSSAVASTALQGHGHFGAPAGEAGLEGDLAGTAAQAAVDAGLAGPGRFVNAAARALGFAGAGRTGEVDGLSLEDMQSMLHQLTTERASLLKRLDAEKDRRRRAEEASKEAGRKLALLEHTDRVDKRKIRELTDNLRHAEEEREELRRMLSHQASQVYELERQRDALDKKLSHYDDDFYKLEARNMRDKVKMDELARAKAKADEERAMYKTMLQASHERGLKERQELRREALQKIEVLTKDVTEYKEEIHRCKQKLFEQEQALKQRLRLEEEMGMYKNMLLEERMARVELEQRIEAGAGTPTAVAAESASAAAASAGASSRLMGGIRRMQRTNSWSKKALGGTPGNRGGSTALRDSPRDDRPPSATAFFKGMAGGLGALATDLADAALGTDPAVAAAAAGPPDAPGPPMCTSPPPASAQVSSSAPQSSPPGKAPSQAQPSNGEASDSIKGKS